MSTTLLAARDQGHRMDMGFARAAPPAAGTIVRCVATSRIGSAAGGFLLAAMRRPAA
jgi:hypothetical protein